MQEIESEVSSTSGENALLKKSTDDQLLSPSDEIRSGGVSTSRHVTGGFSSYFPLPKSRYQATTLPLQDSKRDRHDRQFSTNRTMPLDQVEQNSSSCQDERLFTSSTTDNLLNELYTDTRQPLKEPATQDAPSTTPSLRRPASKRRSSAAISEGSTSVDSSFRSINSSFRSINSSFQSIHSSIKSTNSGLSSSFILVNEGIDTSGSLSILLASESKRQSAGPRLP